MDHFMKQINAVTSQRVHLTLQSDVTRARKADVVAHLLPLHGAERVRCARHRHSAAAHGLHQAVLGQRQWLVHGGQADQVVVVGVVMVVVVVGVAVRVVGVHPQGAGSHHPLNGAAAAVLGDGGVAEVSVGFPRTQKVGHTRRFSFHWMCSFKSR